MHKVKVRDFPENGFERIVRSRDPNRPTGRKIQEDFALALGRGAILCWDPGLLKMINMEDCDQCY
jgi:hypothetical protein